ncbi:MAG: sulfur carrier protein ThiS [Sphingobacteriaceae bacterium]|nr:MAG: sulfur carrier protein ThiS [Sphingobacteriaceae bacterium]
MEVTVNQQNLTVSEICSVAQLLATALNKPALGIAVAVNQTIVPKANWQTHLLQPQDQIILIKATQGG